MNCRRSVMYCDVGEKNAHAFSQLSPRKRSFHICRIYIPNKNNNKTATVEDEDEAVEVEEEAEEEGEDEEVSRDRIAIATESPENQW